MTKKQIFKEVCKFLSGAFFVTAGASWYFWTVHMSVPFFSTSFSPEFLGIRGFMHFAFFVVSFYFGFIRK